MKLKKIILLTFTNACLIALLIRCTSPSGGNKIGPKNEASKPNILFIMTDDHTKQAMSAYSSKLIHTPNIDRIAEEGILFKKSFVTNSICGPSRAVMLTGKYSHMNGFKENTDNFDAGQRTFPKILQNNGYETAVVGKWHLKSQPTGFDYWNVLPGQGHYYNPDFIEMGDTIQQSGYVTDITTDLAIQYLNERDQTKPFCLLLHQKAPHRNWMPSTEHLDLFLEDTIPLPSTFFDDYSTRSPSVTQQDMKVEDMYLSLDMKLQSSFYEEENGSGGHANHDAVKDWELIYKRLSADQKQKWDLHYEKVNQEFRNQSLSGRDLSKWKFQRYVKDYLRCVVSVDENIGRILDYLKSNNLSNNTIVVYTSDQGFYLGEHGWYDKRYMYEESFSTPLAIRFPDEIAAGQVSHHLVLNLDYAPTLLDYAGLNIPDDMQGNSLRPLCMGSTPAIWRDAVYYHYYQSSGWHHVPKHYGVRTDRYKLIHYYENEDWEMYDLQNDPHEMNNIYGNKSHLQESTELRKKLRNLQEFYQVPVDLAI